jgi:hypothetical protein
MGGEDLRAKSPESRVQRKRKRKSYWLFVIRGGRRRKRNVEFWILKNSEGL